MESECPAKNGQLTWVQLEHGQYNGVYVYVSQSSAGMFYLKPIHKMLCSLKIAESSEAPNWWVHDKNLYITQLG